MDDHTPLLQDQQTSGIDLPVKALAWQGAQRHGPGAASESAVEAVGVGLTQLVQQAAGPSGYPKTRY